MGRSRKPLYGQLYRGFESLSLRAKNHSPPLGGIFKSDKTVKRVCKGLSLLKIKPARRYDCLQASLFGMGVANPSLSTFARRSSDSMRSGGEFCNQLKVFDMESAASFGGYDPLFDDPWYVYILSCADGTYYVGCTSNLKDRLHRHSHGWVPSTKKRLPVKLHMYHVFDNKHHAYTYEKYLKSGSGRAFLNRHLT